MGEKWGFDAVALQRYPQLERNNHVPDAGNTSGIVDGAAAVLVGTRPIGKALGLTPRARIRAFATYGTEPTIMLTGPSFASEKARFFLPSLVTRFEHKPIPIGCALSPIPLFLKACQQVGGWAARTNSAKRRLFEGRLHLA